MFVRFRLLSRSPLSAISFKLVHDFLFRLFNVLPQVSASVAAELLSDSTTFLDPDLFLFLLFASNKVVPVVTDGIVGEAISSVILTSILLVAPSSELTGFRTVEREGSDFKDGLAFGGHSSFIWPRGVPLVRFRWEQK